MGPLSPEGRAATRRHASPARRWTDPYTCSSLEHMSVALQGSLLDLVDEGGLRPLAGAVHRTVLTRGAWVDIRPGWVTGADELFSRLTLGGSAGVPWKAERREMYEREVDVPRLLKFYDEGERWPDPVLERARD